MRRLPLQELPLHQYLPAVPDNKQIRTNKRPLSPGGTAFISPAKRRNLTVQDIFASERTFESTSTSLRKNVTSPTRFSNILVGSGSPARILDFGLPTHLAGDPEKSSLADTRPADATPRQKSQLAPSPELKSKLVRSTSTGDDDEVFSRTMFPATLASSSSTSDNSYTLVLRELPARTDPRSVHYPGFVVYQDPHIVAFDSRPHQGCEIEDDDGPKENVQIAFPIVENVSTFPYSNPHKATFDDDRNFARLKFKPPSTARRIRGDIAKSLSLTTLSRKLDTAAFEGKKMSRRMLQTELDLEEESDAVDD
jgi:hypothetical protein